MVGREEISDFELTNSQREYFGLDPVEEHWDKVVLKGDSYRTASYLYFEGDTIKRHIVSTNFRYQEIQYNELTIDRKFLAPKTAKGKEKALTGSTLESRTPIGVYVLISEGPPGEILIGNRSTQTTFYSRSWEPLDSSAKKSILELIDEFVANSPPKHLEEINEFKNSKKKNVSFKSGDYFVFKLNRTQYGFGRILLDIGKIRKKGLLPAGHGLSYIMTMPVLVQHYVYASASKDIDIKILDTKPKLPSDIMMDNVLIYGEYEIIGHRSLPEEELEFPISYGRTIQAGSDSVFLQWGMIHLELPVKSFNNFVSAENPFADKSKPSHPAFNSYGYYSVGFRPKYDSVAVANAVNGIGVYDKSAQNFAARFDLRNPENDSIRRQIFQKFGLDPDANYLQNCARLSNVLRVPGVG